MSILSYFQRARPSSREPANDLNLDEPDQHTSGSNTLFDTLISLIIQKSIINLDESQPSTSTDTGESIPAEREPANDLNLDEPDQHTSGSNTLFDT